MSKTSQLTELTTADVADLLAIADVSAGQSKKITALNFLRSFAGGILPRNIDLRVADATAQAALTPVEGMLIYRQDLDKQVMYDGSAWRVLAGWELLGSQILGTAGDQLTLPSLPTRKFLRVGVHLISTGGTIAGQYRFNNDSGTNYAQMQSVNFGASGNQVSQPQIYINAASSTSVFYGLSQIINLSSQRKTIIHQGVDDNAANATSSCNNITCFAKWANTSAQISRVDVNNGGTGDFAVGSQLIVIGADFA